MSILSVHRLTKYFGGLAAVKDASFDIEKDEIVGMIGPNGSGKTTIFNMISGYYRPSSGRIEFKGRNVTSLPPHKICKLGIGRTFQTVKPFPSMNVLQNATVGAIYGGRRRVSLREGTEYALKLLEFCGLYEKKDLPVGGLTLIDLKRLEMVKALSTKPELILLDELMAGLNLVEIDSYVKLIEEIHRTGITILMIEHVMKPLMGLSERVIVLDHGEKIAEGSPKEVCSDKAVIEAYLGCETVA